MRTILVAAVLAALSVSVPAVAQETTASDQQASPAAPSPADVIVCEKSDPPLGSRIGSTKVCHTAAQWKMIHNNARNMMDSISRGNAYGTGGGG